MSRRNSIQVVSPWRLVLATMLLGSGVTFASETAVTATTASEVGDAINLGEVDIVDPFNPDEVLERGTKATEFTVRPPAGATCPGDSAHDQWQVQSFIVTADVDPASLRFGIIGPEGPEQYALYKVDEDPYTHALTLQNEVPGEPALVAAVPPLSFAVFPDDVLPSGTYRIGLACDYFRVPGQYWATEIVIDADAEDGFAWRLASADAVPQPPNSRRNLIVGLAAIIPVLALAGGLRRRRQRSASQLSPSADGLSKEFR